MPPKPLMNASTFGDLSTPEEAVSYLLPYIPKHWTIWEPAVGEGRLADALECAGHEVVKSGIGYVNNKDFLDDAFFILNADCIITNPPFSKKAQFLRRCRILPQPYALLLPITTLGARRCQQYLDDVQVLFLPHRIDFTGKRAPWFSVAWFTRGFSLPKQMVFV